jgi:hypothetical protein
MVVGIHGTARAPAQARGWLGGCGGVRPPRMRAHAPPLPAHHASPQRASHRGCHSELWLVVARKSWHCARINWLVSEARPVQRASTCSASTSALLARHMLAYLHIQLCKVPGVQKPAGERADRQRSRSTPLPAVGRLIEVTGYPPADGGHYWLIQLTQLAFGHRHPRLRALGRRCAKQRHVINDHERARWGC